MLARSIYALIVAALAALASATPSSSAESPCASVLDHKFPNLQDEQVTLCQFSGKVLLIVNTASECGYTPQYEGLEKLYRRYRDKGFVILGFPANDFGGQEPGSNKEIAQFCRLNYGVTFPMFAKNVRRGCECKPAVSRPRRADRETAALEFPQVPPRPGRAAGSGVRKCRRTRGFTDHFADRETTRRALTPARETPNALLKVTNGS